MSAGIRLAKELEGRIPLEREAERKGLLTKLLVEEAEYEEAIEMSRLWQNALEQKMEENKSDEEKEENQDRIRQAHLIRMQSYRNLGYRDKDKLPLEVAEAECVKTGTARHIGLL